MVVDLFLYSNIHSNHCLQSENDYEYTLILSYMNDTLSKRCKDVQIDSCDYSWKKTEHLLELR